LSSKLVILFTLTLGIALSGCTKDIRDPNQQTEGLRPSPGQSASEAKSPEDRAKQDGPRTNGKVDIDYLKTNLQPGLTQDQALERFGTGYRLVVHPEGGTPMWRYDFADVGYQFQATGQTLGTNIAQADIDGLSKGMIHMQLFVGWDSEQHKSSYSELYYLDDTAATGAHKVRLYTVYPDGSHTDQELPAV
jgi:hypothetical protein